MIAWRSDTWLMFQPTPQNPPRNPDIATPNQISESGTNATGRPDRLNPMDIATSIRPTPTRSVIGLVTRAAASTPTDPTENANPIAAGPSPRSTVRYRMRIEPITLPKKFDVPVVAAMFRSHRCPVT